MFKFSSNNGKWNIKSIGGTIAVLGLCVSPFISQGNSGNNIAIKDPSGKPSICFGHTKNVRMSDKATEDQCVQYLKDDYFEAALFVINKTPDITNNPNVLKASVHYVFSNGEQSYLDSPMYKHFIKGEWESGCKSFSKYNITRRYKFRKYGRICSKVSDGTWVCLDNDLVNDRSNEMKTCLSKNIK